MLCTRTLGRLILACAAASAIAFAQRPVSPPPAKPAAPAAPSPAPSGERQISPSSPPAEAGSGGRGKPTCEEVRRKARFAIYFSPAVDIDKLVQTVADA